MKYIKKILAILLCITSVIYLFNIERDKSEFFMWLLFALQNTIIFIDLNRENKKKDSILYGVTAVLFWAIILINIYLL